jgi:hypothetical protein
LDEENSENIIETGFEGYNLDKTEDECSLDKLTIRSNVANLNPVDMGVDDGYELGF